MLFDNSETFRPLIIICTICGKVKRHGNWYYVDDEKIAKFNATIKHALCVQCEKDWQASKDMKTSYFANTLMFWVWLSCLTVGLLLFYLSK